MYNHGDCNFEGLPGGVGAGRGVHVPLFPIKFPCVPVFPKSISLISVFPVPSGERIQNVPFSRIFLCGFVRCSVDGRPNRNNK